MMLRLPVSEPTLFSLFPAAIYSLVCYLYIDTCCLLNSDYYKEVKGGAVETYEQPMFSIQELLSHSVDQLKRLVDP